MCCQNGFRLGTMRTMKHPLLILSIICLGSGAAFADDLFDGAPAAPPGYDDYKKAQGAVILGKVPLVEVPESAPETIEFYDDVVYATHDGVELSLDIFVPKGIDDARPVVLFIHGGGWSKGKKEDYLVYNIAFAELGYVTASVQYRLTPDHTFPANIQDVKCAIAFLREHAAKYHIDPKQIVTAGGSAGGHLSLLAAYSQDDALVCPEHRDKDTSVQAAINFYGVVDCTTSIAIEAREVTHYIGKSYSDAKESYEAASPIFHLDKGDPPTLTFHGTIDELVPIAQADTLHEKLDELGVPNYYDRVEGWPHTMDAVKPINDRCCYIIEKFLSKHAPLPE